MLKKMFTPDQIVTKLREIEVALAHGKSVSLACREAGMQTVTQNSAEINSCPPSAPMAQI